MSSAKEKMVLALPKGRILKEVMPLVRAAGIEPEPAFDDGSARQLRFASNRPDLDIVRVRSFDVATFVAFGAADLGVVKFMHRLIWALAIAALQWRNQRKWSEAMIRAPGATFASPPSTLKLPAATLPSAVCRLNVSS